MVPVRESLLSVSVSLGLLGWSDSSQEALFPARRRQQSTLNPGKSVPVSAGPAA